MRIDVEKIIKNVIEKNYPSDHFYYIANDYTDLPADYLDETQNVSDVGDGSGRQFFVWGFSSWNSNDIISE